MTTTEATLTRRLYSSAREIRERQLRHPFVRALGEGTLPEEKFVYYITQDALFLDELARAFAYAAARTGDAGDRAKFAELLENTIHVEQSLHRSYLSRYGLSDEQVSNVQMAPTNYAYTRHILYTAACGSVAQLVASILPCAWIYAEVGRHFRDLGLPTEDHAYRDWLLVYASPEFEEVGEWLRGVLDERAPRLDGTELGRLEEIFFTSCRYEWMFWEMAWREERWSV